MAEKFIELVNGEFVENEGLQTSAGAGDAGKIPALDPAGRISQTMMPVGVGPETGSIVAGENLTAGNFVNVYNDAGTPKVRKADNSNSRRAHGFVLSSYTAGQTATVNFDGNNTALTSRTPGAVQYLGTIGAATETPPTLVGGAQISQQIGFAVSATEAKFSGKSPITLA
jgi:hypothetical protein